MRRTGMRLYGLLSLCLMCFGTAPQIQAAPATLTEAIRATLAQHPSLVGRSFELQFFNSNSQLQVCEDWWFDLPVRDRMIGSLRIPTRCPSKPLLNKTLIVSVQATAPVLVAARNLAPNHVIQTGDWKAVVVDLGKQAQDVIEDEQILENKEVIHFIRAGNAIRLNDLHALTVIRTGDQVKLSLIGQGFSITATGQSMSNAAVGGTVRVRTLEGKVLQGTAVSAGQVEVTLD